MMPAPRFYENILIFRGDPRDEGRGAVAKIGGAVRQPNIPLSYLWAARVLLEKGAEERKVSELALPIAYLQRHAYETALKDLLEAAYGIEADTEWLCRLSKNSRRA